MLDIFELMADLQKVTVNFITSVFVEQLASIGWIFLKFGI
jgi:hypothetical protein